MISLSKNDYIDYKDVETLKKFLTPHARIQSSQRSGVPSKSQRQLALAIKRARYMGLLPYVSR
ncbi:MAG: 30S ribosomal protein S18 [Candidatus Zambryskibacteria bacterium]|nr:30S ribosomal protein S18 [Candidatus Zambryskibacteria bacterium]